MVKQQKINASETMIVMEHKDFTVIVLKGFYISIKWLFAKSMHCPLKDQWVWCVAKQTKLMLQELLRTAMKKRQTCC